MDPQQPQPNQPQQPPVQPTPLPQEGQPVPPVQPQRDRIAEFIVPINRSPLSIAAGYFALFSFPFLVPAPIALLLGILGLSDIAKHPNRAGKGRCWFAVIYGAIWTIALIWFVWLLISKQGQ